MPCRLPFQPTRGNRSIKVASRRCSLPEAVREDRGYEILGIYTSCRSAQTVRVRWAWTVSLHTNRRTGQCSSVGRAPLSVCVLERKGRMRMQKWARLGPAFFSLSLGDCARVVLCLAQLAKPAKGSEHKHGGLFWVPCVCVRFLPPTKKGKLPRAAPNKERGKVEQNTKEQPECNSIGFSLYTFVRKDHQ